MSEPSNRKSGLWWLATLWLVLVALAALFAGALPLPYAPDAPDLYAIAEPPLTDKHWLGTDPLGRDVLANLIYGARTACLVSVPAALLATLAGALLGSMAGYWGNHGLRLSRATAAALASFALLWGCFRTSLPWFYAVPSVLLLILKYALRRRSSRMSAWAVPLDAIFLAAIALLTAVPRLVLVLAIAAVWPPTLPALIGILVVTYWPVAAQLARADMQRIRQLPYIEAARALGLPPWQIIGRHALPSIWQTLRAALPLSLATLIALETTLSFLGVGLPPETASWGRLLAAARLEPTAWWLTALPGGAILLTTLSLRQLTSLARQLK